MPCDGGVTDAWNGVSTIWKMGNSATRNTLMIGRKGSPVYMFCITREADWHPGTFSNFPWNGQMVKYLLWIKIKGGDYPLVFFHFHGLKFFSDEKVACCDALYELDKDVKELLYFPYFRCLLETGYQVTQAGFKRNPHGARNKPLLVSGKSFLNMVKILLFSW